MKRFRVQKRDMSPDVIEKNIGTDSKEKWVVYICPCGSRFDNIAHDLCNHLNSTYHE